MVDTAMVRVAEPPGEPIVAPFDRLGRCPHALGALRWRDAQTIRCAHCGAVFTVLPYQGT